MSLSIAVIPGAGQSGPWTEQPTSDRWYTRPAFRRVAGMIFLLAVVIEGIVAVGFRENDYLWHWETGEAFLRGVPYEKPGNCYPLGRVAFNSLLARLDHRVSRLFAYAGAVTALAATMAIWNRLATGSRLALAPISLAAWSFTLALLYPYVIRDLDDCGINLLLLFLLSSAALAAVHHRDGAAGMLVAAAATHRIVPLLAVGVFVLHRRFRAVAWTGAFLAVFNLGLPALALGWRATLDANALWFARVTHAVDRDAPEDNGVEPPRHQNQSLSAAVGRFLQTYPPGHPLYLDHPWFFQFGHAAPRTARLVSRLLLVALAFGLAWRFGRRQSPQRQHPADDDARLWAAVCLLCAVASPSCWLQLLVLELPAMFLVMRRALESPSQARTTWLGVGFLGFVVLLLQRDVVQWQLSVLILSYKLDLIAALVLLLLVCGQKGRPAPALADLPRIPALPHGVANAKSFSHADPEHRRAA